MTMILGFSVLKMRYLEVVFHCWSIIFTLLVCGFRHTEDDKLITINTNSFSN